MAFELHDGVSTGDRGTGDLDGLASFYLASELVIEHLADAMKDVLPRIVAGTAHDASSRDPGARTRRSRLGAGCSAGAPDGWNAAMAARCAILLQRGLER